jgi:flagellar biosynthesis protein FlhF
MLLNEALKTTHVAGLPDDRSVRCALQQEIAQRVRITGPLLHGDGRPAVGLLIGPSGAGKTSAVAKLAAYYRLEQRKSVALITFDTYRETAVEQLRRFAKIVGVPFACALSARQVQEGLRRHAQMDLVLIDMPGVGPDDLALARDLRRLLKKDTMTTHLVLPASTREQEACRITRRLGDLPRLCLFFTKLDETESLGTIFEVMHATGVPLSYWSVGRRVPGDIEVASPEQFTARLGALGPVEGQERIGHWIRSADALSALTGMGTHHG